jgi:threonine dehydrogenase-like Zn-dependent dehydrogenase
VDRLVEATGSSAVFAESLGLVESGGALSVVAFYDRPLDRFDIDAFVFADVALVPVGGSLGMYPPVLELMAAGRFDASALVTERLRLEGVPGLLARFRDDPGRLKAMVEM